MSLKYQSSPYRTIPNPVWLSFFMKLNKKAFYFIIEILKGKIGMNLFSFNTVPTTTTKTKKEKINKKQNLFYYI